MSKQYPAMKSKVVLLPPGQFVKAGEFSRSRQRRIQHIANEFWVIWLEAVLWSLQTRPKWNSKCRNFQKDDSVLLKTEANGNQWPIAKVIRVNADDLGFILSFRLLLSSSCDVREYWNDQYIRLHWSKKLKFDSLTRRYGVKRI